MAGMNEAIECSFYGRSAAEVAHSVTGPDGHAVCDDCLLRIAEGILGAASALSRQVMCSFCARADRQPHGMGRAGKVTICTQCTRAALQTLKAKRRACQAMAEKLAAQIDS